MPRHYLATNVLEEAVSRLASLYRDGHRVVYSFSGGKDSTCLLECGILAASKTGRLPVEVVMRDEELGWPGHYEYCERVAARPEVDFTWIVAHEPHSYAFDRECPFYWSFDTRAEGLWLRRYPPQAVEIEPITIEAINTVERFPPPEGKLLVTPIGIRAGESRNRLMGVHSMGGWRTAAGSDGRQAAWPIYDWGERDVWRAIAEMGWDFASAYTELWRSGVKRSQLRMGSFTNRYALPMFPIARKVWPDFFERLCARFPSLRAALRYGDALLRPRKFASETWEDCFRRECIERAPDWIAERSLKVEEVTRETHARHASYPLPDDRPCSACANARASWREIAEGMYLGDAWSELSASVLQYVEPEVFRPELAGTPAGRWGGHPG